MQLVTVLGDDMTADLLARMCQDEKIGLMHAVRVSGSSGTYLSLHDADGDMAAAVCDTAALEGLTPALLEPALARMADAPLVVVDANLPQAVLEALVATITAPMLLDPVSGAKAERARGIIGRFAAVKPNLLEAERLTGEADPARACDWLLDKGVGRVFISMGAEGVYYADAAGQGHVPAPHVRLRNCTGAGDAMTAGIALALMKGLPVRACAGEGIRFATEQLILQGGVLL